MNPLTLTLTDPYPQAARGRNGWFTPRTLTLDLCPENTGYSADPHIRLGVSAARHGRTEPIVLHLSGPDAYALGAALMEAATQQDAEARAPSPVVEVSLTRRPRRAAEAEAEEPRKEPQP